MTITVKVNLRAASARPTTWRVFPGEGYRFLNQFEEQGLVFLDLPDLQIGSNKVSEVYNLIGNVKRSHSIAKNWKVKSSNSDNKNPALTNINSWPKNLTIYKSAIEGLFQNAKEGDLVVVPGRHYVGTVTVDKEKLYQPIKIGEFVSGPETREAVSIKRYEGLMTPARRVRWLDEFTDADVGYEISRLLRTPNPVISIGRDASEFLLPIAYSNFWSPEECTSRFRVGAEDFGLTSNWELQTFFKAFAVAYQAVCQGKELDHRNVYDLAGRDLHADFNPSTESVIRSPGDLRLRLARSLPIASAIMLGLASCDDIKPAEISPDNIEILMIGKHDDPEACQAEIVEKTLDAMRIMGVQTLLQACELGRDASKASSITVDIEVEGERAVKP